MNQKLKKEEEVTTKKTSYSKNKEKPTPVIDLLGWENAISQLSEQNFETYAEAIDALIDSVHIRIGEGVELERDFLREFIAGDPEIEEILKRSLRIKSF